jgi:CheY-like chemotaxis protein
MEKTIVEKAFDPFFTTKEMGKGTGLGLSTVYGIVKQHNGYITVYSEPAVGTTFRIYFPIADDASIMKKQAPSSIRGGRETILVTEDNEAVRNLIRDILRQYGYTVIEATDGQDAVDKFKKNHRIDLLLLDSVMPKINGREVYRQISETKPDIKVLFLSGYTRDVILDKGIEDELYDFISKPIAPNTLLLKVREVLDRQELP